MRLIMKWLVTCAALFVAAWLVPGIKVAGNAWLAFFGMAAVLGVVNVTLKPVLKLLTCPFIVLTLGLLLLVINALTLWFASKLAQAFGIGYRVDGFFSALAGALIVSVVSVVLGVFVPGKKRGGAPDQGRRAIDIEEK